MYIFKTNADRTGTYISSLKENVHRNVEEIGELFPLKRLPMYEKTLLAFEPNLITSKAMARC